MGKISLPRHAATISASRAISQRPCSISKITKSSPHDASICPMPGVNSSSTIWPKSTSPWRSRWRKVVIARRPSAENAALYFASFSQKGGTAQHLGIDDMLRRLSAIDCQGALAIDASHVAEQLLGPGDGM